ncbi:MAG: PadR family transcriptional regulator [Streptosporangiaceae bacterium]|jgi:DNA-binding PadR family transcriptional regulator
MPPAPPRPSPSGLTVLALLGAGPLHPYGMQRLIKSWGKDEVVNIGQRANLYKTIRRLHQAGLIAVRQTERAQQYPERTVYELTEEGRRAGLRWLRDMLAAPRNEYPVFPAALSFAMTLDPDQVSGVLTQRLAVVQARLAHLDSQLQDHRESVPRIALIETEYQRAVTDAEARWLSSVIDDLKSGKLCWDHDEIAAQAAETFYQAGNLLPGRQPLTE